MKMQPIYLVTLSALISFSLIGCTNNQAPDPAPDTGKGRSEDAADTTSDADPEDPGCPFDLHDMPSMRLFTFASQIHTDHAESYESYEAYFRGQVEAIESCLHDEKPNLLLFPEDAGLHAGLIGTRGAAARKVPRADMAFASLINPYRPSWDWVKDEFDVQPLPRHIFLSLTDTLWRAVNQTFGGIAKDYGVWVLTSANVAEVQESFEPELIELWADPDFDEVESVFIPTSPQVYNSAIIFNPDGELVARVHKPYLTATEEEELALSYGPPELLRPIQIGPMRLGILTSKDAWMPPVHDRLALLGADLQVQPEAFSGWAIAELEDQEEWLPDVLTQSGWSAVQKYPSYRYGAMPVLTGNFIGMVFDGQAAIWGQAHPGVAFGGFVGQHERPGFLAITPWAMADPIEEDPTLLLEERRERLREFGQELLSGSGSEFEDAYFEGVTALDLFEALDYEIKLDLKVDPKVGASSTVASPTSLAQRPQIATEGDRLTIVWQDGAQQPALKSRTFTWSGDIYEPSPEEVLEETISAVAPAITAGAEGTMITAFQAVGATNSTLRILRRDDSGWTPVELPWAEEFRDCWLPALASDGAKIALAFTSRESGQDRVYLSLSTDDGQSFSYPISVDEPPAVAPPNTRGNQWHPTVALRGDRIAVVWADFRDFQWDLYGSVSSDGGESWSDSIRLDDAGHGFERLHTDPRLLLIDEQHVLLSWTYQADRQPNTQARYLKWDLESGQPGLSTVLNAPGQDYPAMGWLPNLASVGDDFVATWMKLSGPSPTIQLLLPGADKAITASNPAYPAWAPALTVIDERLILTWIEHRPAQGYSVQMVTLSL